MLRLLRHLRANDAGAATVEYAVAIGVIVLGSAAILWQFSPKLVSRWGNVDAKLDGGSVTLVNAPASPNDK